MENIISNIIIIAILVLIIGGVIYYLYKAKKRGQTCIGCPYAKQCSGKCSCQNNKTEKDK